MNFTSIDLQTWPRGQMFYYYSKIAPTGYSLTVDIDVTIVKKVLKGRSIRFFPAYIWLVTRALNRQIEFKVAYQNDVLGYYNVLTPIYPSFHEETKTISLMWTSYEDDFAVFYQNYLENFQKYGDKHGVISQPEPPPPNSYVVSCLPWVEFRHFAVHSYENKGYFFPSVESGKFYEKDGRILMPLSITAHHATTDGWHIKELLDELQNDFNHPENWLN